MNRDAFDHAVRAAGSVLGENEVLVIGSQAIHGTIRGDLPPEAERSVEADVAAFDDPEDRKADLIDGSIGEASMFHETFGYYAKGVSESTAVLPERWRERLIRYESPATNGVVAWCLEINDLWLSKAVAARPKDVEFCRALAQRGLVDVDTLRRRVDEFSNIDAERRERLRRFVERYAAM